MSKPNPRRVLPHSQRFAIGSLSYRLAAQVRQAEARKVKAISSESEVRQELVRRVRREILAGTYDTLEKFEAALDRMSNRFDRD